MHDVCAGHSLKGIDAEVIVHAN
ncbi:uncharacterized protein METZ01_LOCUS273035 [marine metagenome]|uniref:Uncharacterized protein n=1 Tax=marine metagenome TaxID=408172 RepID=A0A382KBT2_9ZZZZ